ncbi:MAG: dihydroorotate dehydrogenase electron transfer subunit [Solobacterium sp.]|nr:dihydroorotate dehydrogenase electron transfer subunit [Solobacterium sp.]
MKQRILTVTEMRQLTPDVFEMKLTGIEDASILPGQFVNLSISNLFLRRPISVCDANGNELKLVYRVVGEGTERLRQYKAQDTVDVLVELGNGYDLTRSGEQPLLIGGGVGVPPLYYLARTLIGQGKQVTAILGFNKAEECFYEEEFQKLGVKTIVTTVDGSYGQKGFVTDALPEVYSYFYACGPMPMMKALYQKTTTSGEFSLEERMGCGFGACMGCSIQTKNGPKRVCKEGPVFRKEDLLWDD